MQSNRRQGNSTIRRHVSTGGRSPKPGLLIEGSPTLRNESCLNALYKPPVRRNRVLATVLRDESNRSALIRASFPSFLVGLARLVVWRESRNKYAVGFTKSLTLWNLFRNIWRAFMCNRVALYRVPQVSPPTRTHSLSPLCGEATTLTVSLLQNAGTW